MNNRFKRLTSGLLSIVGLAGLSQAHAQDALPVQSRKFAQSFRLLVKDGLIVPLSKPNVFRLNKELLDLKLRGETPSTIAIPELIETLRDVVGPDVDIRQVDVIVAVFGTQDMK